MINRSNQVVTQIRLLEGKYLEGNYKHAWLYGCFVVSLYSSRVNNKGKRKGEGNDKNIKLGCALFEISLYKKVEMEINQR